MNINEVLGKYFTETELVKLNQKMVYAPEKNELLVDEIRFSIKDGELVLEEFPKKFGYEIPADKKADYRAWEAVAFIKVRIINSAEDIIERARTGELYDESYYTARGGGGPYTNYPYRYDGVTEEDRFKDQAIELKAKYPNPGNISFLKRFFGAKPKVLDCGCATGTFVNQLLKVGYDAYGFDISEFAIKNGICKNLYLADGRKLPFKDGEFDILVSQDYMEHIHPDDLPVVLEEQKRILKKGGIALHFIPFYKDYDKPVQLDAHLCNANRNWWKSFFESTNILKVDYAPDEDGQWDYSEGILPKYFILRKEG
jgi:SAM-dependent methyltransferase